MRLLQIKLISVSLVFLFVVAVVSGKTVYVSPAGGHIYPYTNWQTSATDIQSAVLAADNLDTVLVTNGTYILSEQVAVTNSITVKSVEGSEVTIVSGSNSCRCFYVGADDAVIDGFTIRDGYAWGSWPAPYGGGGVLCDTGMVKNCVIITNVAFQGGGVSCRSSGVIDNCSVIHNRGQNGTAGIICWGGIIRNCFIAENNASYSSGGGIGVMQGAIIENCYIVKNIASDAAGIFIDDFSMVKNCTIIGNIAYYEVGGISCGDDSLVVNTIIYGNIAPSNANYNISGQNSEIKYSCSIPLLPGIGNITNDPSLTPSYRLRSDSPCIDAGMTNDVLTDFDGEARWDNPAHSNIVSIVDIGADEFVDTDLDDMADFWETKTFGSITNSDGTTDNDNDNLSDAAEYDNGTNPDDADSDDDELNDGAELNNSTDPLDSDTDDDGMPDGWEVASTINPLVNDAAEDPDSDGMNNIGEYNADTLPMDSNSVLCILSVSPEWGGIRIEWQGGLGAWQFLECTEKLPAEEWTPILGFPPYTMQITNTVIDFPATGKSLFYRIRAER